jgi:hypothetical protein
MHWNNRLYLTAERCGLVHALLVILAILVLGLLRVLAALYLVKAGLPVISERCKSLLAFFGNQVENKLIIWSVVVPNDSISLTSYSGVQHPSRFLKA